MASTNSDFVVKNGLIVNNNLIWANSGKVGINNSSPDANLTVTGTANISGKVTLGANAVINGRLDVTNVAYIDTRLYVGNTDTMVTLTNPIIQAVDNFNGFVQVSSQNLSKEDDACADLLIYADNTNGLTYFNDVGLNNSRFDGRIHRVSANTLADNLILGETVFQSNGTANIAVGIVLNVTTINATSRSVAVAVANGGSFVNTAGGSLALSGVSSLANTSILVAVPFGASSEYSRRNYPFTIGLRTDGYLYQANAALTIGTTEGGIRAAYQSSLATSITFSSGANTVTCTSTTSLYPELIIEGTGIPANTRIVSVTNSTSFKINKSTTAANSGAYTFTDPAYDAAGNPIIFHTNGMLAENEVGRISGNGNLTLGSNTISRSSRLTVDGRANITGNAVVGGTMSVASNLAVDGTLLYVDATSNRVGVNTGSPDAAFAVVGTANVVGNLTVNGSIIVTGNLVTTGTFAANGDVIPVANSFDLGNTINRWDLFALSVEASNTVNVGITSTNVQVNTTSINFSNSTVVSTINAVNYSGTAANATLFNGQPASYYANATNLSSGTVAPARLPQANSTTNGAVLILDSVTNTAVAIYAAAPNSVKTAYDAAISANTRANSAQTAAASAYTNAASYADTKAGQAYTNAITYSGNAAAAYANAIAYSGNAAAAYANAITYSANATNLTNGTIPYAVIPANIINTTASFTRTGTTTFSASVILGSSGLSANGGFGTGGQVLTSNGTATYWSTLSYGYGSVTQVNSGSGLSGGPITGIGTLSVVAGNTQLVSNSGGIWANQANFNHNALTNYVADQHVAHSGVSITAGNGLTGGGDITTSRTLHVGAGTGITVGADTVSVDSAYIATISANNASYLGGQPASDYARTDIAETFDAGAITIGNTAGYNIRVQTDNIQARYLTGASDLYLNPNGGWTKMVYAHIDNLEIKPTQLSYNWYDSYVTIPVANASYGAISTVVATTSGRKHIRFENPNGEVGSISTSGTATSFTTSSDHRLKTDVQPIGDASERLLQLNPVRFKWISDTEGPTVDGFLAHEVQEIVPEAVIGTKDEVDPDTNKPIYQGIDQSKIVPLLVASLQEALLKIANLEERLAALEL